jgi:Short C-terminal domain
MARRPSILGSAVRTAGRTAIIAGTATAVSNKVAAKQANAGAPPAQPPSAESPPAVPASAGISEEALGRLTKLAELHKAGILTDEEFASQKARILG